MEQTPLQRKIEELTQKAHAFTKESSFDAILTEMAQWAYKAIKPEPITDIPNNQLEAGMKMGYDTCIEHVDDNAFDAGITEK